MTNANILLSIETQGSVCCYAVPTIDELKDNNDNKNVSSLDIGL